ncbi:hypothetical protein LTR08_003917 [Meristemomyces frigidus]|nr:hypothetical protein LTR08_003917 [Meristemomyces frigidus]
MQNTHEAFNAAPPPPKFGPHALSIYPWEYPNPKSEDFPRLSESRREWKKRIDAEQAANDVDEGLEGWRSLLQSRDPDDEKLGIVIAGAFVKRAKRAFWIKHSWDKFAARERGLVSDHNDARLEVFEQIAARLCNEIWLEEYSGTVVEGDNQRSSLVDGGSSKLKRKASNTLVGAGRKFGDLVGQGKASKKNVAKDSSKPLIQEEGRIGDVDVYGRLGMTAVEALYGGELNFGSDSENEKRRWR